MSKLARTSVKAAALAGLAMVGLAASRAPAAEPTAQELADQVRVLQEKIAKLEAQQQAQSDRPRVAEAKVDAAVVDKAVDDAVRQAGRSTQFLAPAGFTAGVENDHFVIRSEDGNFLLNPNAQFQFRYVSDWRRESKNGVAESDDNQSGFEVRRLKFSLDGNVFTKNLTYKLQWNTGRTNGQLVLDEGYVRYKFDDVPLAVRGGTFANTFEHETEISSKRQLGVERSLAHEILASGAIGGENYVQGVELIYDAGDSSPLRGWVGYTDGFNSRNTAFSDAGPGSAALGIVTSGGAVHGRVEYKFAGDWKNYEDFTALKTKTDLLVIGGGADVEFADNLTAYLHTVDVQWESAAVRGLAAYAGYYGVLRDFRTVAAGIENNPYDWGLVAQVSYLLDDQWEVFGRYSYVGLDSGAPTGTGTLGAAARISDQLHEITVGANYYLKGHSAKFTVDAVYLPNGSPLDLSSDGILAEPNDQSQFLIRAQFQLLL